MVAWMRAVLSDDATADEDAGRTAAAKPEPDGKLEEAVRRAMNDLDQEKAGSRDADRSRPNAA